MPVKGMLDVPACTSSDLRQVRRWLVWRSECEVLHTVLTPERWCAGSADLSEEGRAMGQNPSVPSLAQLGEMGDLQPLYPGSASSSVEPGVKSSSLHALGGTWTIPFKELVSPWPRLRYDPLLQGLRRARRLAAVGAGTWLGDGARPVMPCAGAEEADRGGQHRQGAPGQVAGDRCGREDPQQPVQHWSCGG